MYVQRYWSLLDQLSLDALSGASSQQVSASDQRAIRAYLFLCEDELEIRESGYISDSTYRVWADGMSEQIKQPMFEAVWKQVCNEQTFPYNYLKLMFDGGQDYDPCKMPLWRRRLRGLAGLKGV